MISPTAEQFFGAIADLNPAAFVEKVRDRAIFVCDEQVYDYLSSHWPYKVSPPPLVRYENLSSFLSSRRKTDQHVYYVLSLGREAELLDAILSEYPSLQVLGFVRDVIIALSARVESDKLDALPPADRQLSYAIMCTARSGSTYLCELLGKVFPGDEPRENFRPVIFFLYEHREALNFDFRRWVDVTLRAGLREPFYGTKVIAQFLRRMEPLITEEDLTWFLEEMESHSPRLIYLLRQEKIEQSVSQYLASAVKTWHVRNDPDAPKVAEKKEREYRQLKEAVRYDFDAINLHYSGMVRSEHHLQTILDRLNLPRLNVVYEELVADPKSVLTSIVEFLGGDVTAIPDDLSTRIQRGFDAKNIELAKLFRDDLKEKTASDL